MSNPNQDGDNRTVRECFCATVPWRGFTKHGRASGPQPIRLFKRTWQNPYPDVKVTRLDFVAEHALIVPMLLALTAE